MIQLYKCKWLKYCESNEYCGIEGNPKWSLVSKLYSYDITIQYGPYCMNHIIWFVCDILHIICYISYGRNRDPYFSFITYGPYDFQNTFDNFKKFWIGFWLLALIKPLNWCWCPRKEFEWGIYHETALKTGLSTKYLSEKIFQKYLLDFAEIIF